MVRSPEDKGELGIKDPTMINVSLGANLVWRMIDDSLEWWKKVLWKNYFTSSRSRCVENTLKSQKGSPIFRLLKVAIPLI
jgi:hypothetical protein